MSQLPRRALGRTGIVTPVLGFGVSGPLASNIVSASHVRRLVRKAADQGVEFFDTAPFYGNGLAESRLSEALDATGNRPTLISTKGGTRLVGGQYIKDFSIDGLKQQLKESLQRLPRIDAFFLHGPPKRVLTPDLFNELNAWRERGCFRFLGIAGRGQELDVAIASDAFDLIMAPAHKNLPPADLDRLEHARSLGLGVIGIECLAPAARGVRLSLRPTDVWYSLRAVLRQRPQRHHAATAKACLSWTLNSGLVDIALISTTRPSNLADNVQTARYAAGDNTVG